MPSSKNNHFILSWDTQGLEYIGDVLEYQQNLDDYEKRKIIATLKDIRFTESRPRLPLQELILRARYNSQRFYEIYEFVTSKTIEQVKNEFDNNPQKIVNYIRKHGYKIYSDKHMDKRTIT